MTRGFTESVVEDAALAWLEGAGWRIAHGPEIAPDTPATERARYGEVVLARRLREALARWNPGLPRDALGDAFRKLSRPEGVDPVQRNRALHRTLVDGVTVEYRAADGEIRAAQVRVIDFDRVQANDWLAVNQLGVVENKHSRRPDVVLFVNGLPLALLELKNAADADATTWTAFQQVQAYKAEIPAIFATNAVVVVSDGVEARVGTLTAGREWMKLWRTIAGEALAGAHVPELQVVIEGLPAPRRFLDLVRDFRAARAGGRGPRVSADFGGSVNSPGHLDFHDGAQRHAVSSGHTSAVFGITEVVARERVGDRCVAVAAAPGVSTATACGTTSSAAAARRRSPSRTSAASRCTSSPDARARSAGPTGSASTSTRPPAGSPTRHERGSA